MISWDIWLELEEKVLATCPGWAPASTVLIGQTKFVQCRQPPIMMFLTSFWQCQSRVMCGLKHLLQFIKSACYGGADYSSSAKRVVEWVTIAANGAWKSLAQPKWEPPCPFLSK